MVGLLSSVGLGTWETWMSDSLQGLGVDWFVEQVGVGQLGKLGCQILQGLGVGLLSSLGSGMWVLGSLRLKLASLRLGSASKIPKLT